MELYIQVNPCNPKELREYLDMLEARGLLDFTNVEVTEEQQPKELRGELAEIPTGNTWTTNEDERLDVITREDIRDKMVALNRKGLGKQLIEILNKYGADKVSALSEEHYLEVMAEMEALENESIA